MYTLLWLVAPLHPLFAQLVPGAGLYRKGTFATLRAYSNRLRNGILVGEKRSI